MPILPRKSRLCDLWLMQQVTDRNGDRIADCYGKATADKYSEYFTQCKSTFSVSDG